jgi:hypothetical protein
MPREKETNESQDLNAPVSISAADLLKLFTTLSNQSSEKNAQVLSEALAKLQPGYKSPEAKEYDAKLREDQKKIQITILRNKKIQQRMCEHEVGQTGRHRNGEGAFCCLKLPTGEMIGVCQYCQMVISSTNPEHQRFFRKANGTPAQSGQSEGIVDPIKAQLARLGPDQQAKVLEARKKYFATEATKESFEEEEVF